MKHKILEAMLLAVPLTLAIPAFAAPPEEAGEGDAPAEAEGDAPEISEEEALDDDILLVIDLPIAADEARTAGLENEEIVEALDAADTAAVSPGTMAEVLDDEAEQIKGVGKRKAFGQWVKMQIAEGLHGKELAAKIHERKDELKALSDEEKAELQKKLDEVGKKNREHRKHVHQKRKDLRDAGKLPKLAGEERHAKMVAKANERHAAAKAEWKAAKKAGKHDGPHGGAHDPAHDGGPGDKADAGGPGEPGEPGEPGDKADAVKSENADDKAGNADDKADNKSDKADDKGGGKGHDGHGDGKDKDKDKKDK